MILDLENLPYRLAFDIIKFCLENNIDTENCLRMIYAASDRIYDPELDWSIDIPDKHATMILLKFGHYM